MKTSLRLEGGVKCTAWVGDWQFKIVEPKSMGGDNSAPSPGGYGLSALAFSSWLHVFSNAQNVTADISINSQESTKENNSEQL